MGLRALSREECLNLLCEVPVGRVGVQLGALPAIFPVTFQVWGDDLVLFNAIGGSPLALSADDAVIAFEADSYDQATRTGWTVMGVGRSTCLQGLDDLAGMRGTAPELWITGDEPEVLIQLRLDDLSGHLLD